MDNGGASGGYQDKWTADDKYAASVEMYLTANARAEAFATCRAIPVASVKGAVGESGAAAAAGIIAGLLTLRCGEIPPTAGFETPDPAITIGVNRAVQSAGGDVFLVNSVASGGTNYSIAVRAHRRPSRGV